jgi:DNA modification methylase
MNYEEILEKKKVKLMESGFDVDESQLNPALFDFQRHIVKKALKVGRYALFEDCGLGKTIQQLEWASQVSLKTGNPVLILCPLAVAGQTIKEGEKFGIKVYKYDQAAYIDNGVFVSNYEQLDNIDSSIFSGVVLDESSILKNFTGETKKKLIETFATTPYKLCCTATPSPNDLNEIGNHSEFLNILDAQDMRSKWFVRDEGMNNYRLKGHAKKDFYAWVSSWAVMLTRPSDIGFNASGYDLPPLSFIERQIKTPKRDNGKMFNDGAINATNFNAELRLTKVERLSEVADIVNGSDEQFLIWIKQNEEGEYLKSLIPGAVEVTGSDSIESKEKNLLGFANKEFRVLISKSKICQFGLNFQNCHNQVFASLDFSFESLYQSIRRSYRFGQKHAVNIYMITTDTMENVISSIKRKEKQFMEMQQEMNLNINSKQYGLLNNYEFKEFRTPEMWLMKGDTCIEIDRLEDNSVDLIVFSPPFSSLFTYSNYIHDMGNNENHQEFFAQYAYLLKKLYKKLRPGRMMCCHTKDLGVYQNSSGYTGQYDFTGEHTKAVLNEGFKLHSKITIWTDPVLEMQRTKTQRLLYKTITSDSSSTGIGMAEYITIFKKWEGERETWTPVTNITKKNFPLSEWQKWASPVWGEKIPAKDLKQIQEMVAKVMDKGIDEIDLNSLQSHWLQNVWFDIKRTDVLNNKEGTAMGDEKHIAPLQLEVIHRIVNLWSNKGETVLTPFGGIGSEPYMSIKNNRKAIACELKDSYFDVMVKNCKKAVATANIPTLFDLSA